MKNIVCFIDNLNAGGAQRQICYLAKFLKEHGFNVTLLTYYNSDFFSYYLSKNKINHVKINENTKIKRAYKLFTYLRTKNHDIVIAYLKNPSTFAEIASIGKKWKLIVSERNNDPSCLYHNLLRRLMHLFADHIVVNSATNKKKLKKEAPWLKQISMIYNYVDLEEFHKKSTYLGNTSNIRLLGVGKFHSQKNIINLVKALNILKKDYNNLTINWYGDNYSEKKENSYINEIRKYIRLYDLQKKFILHPETHNIVELYQKSDALILPSIYEGLPNVICEAMSCGLPILASNVCDNSFLVDRKNGFLFDPNNIIDISDKVKKFCNLDEKKIELLGTGSRQKAEELFNKEVFFKKYHSIIYK